MVEVVSKKTMKIIVCSVNLLDKLSIKTVETEAMNKTAQTLQTTDVDRTNSDVAMESAFHKITSAIQSTTVQIDLMN